MSYEYDFGYLTMLSIRIIIGTSRNRKKAIKSSIGHQIRFLKSCLISLKNKFFDIISDNLRFTDKYLLKGKRKDF